MNIIKKENQALYNQILKKEINNYFQNNKLFNISDAKFKAIQNVYFKTLEYHPNNEELISYAYKEFINALAPDMYQLYTNVYMGNN